MIPALKSNNLVIAAIAATLAAVVTIGFQVVQTNQVKPADQVVTSDNTQTAEQAEVTDTVLAVYKNYYRLSVSAGPAAAKEYVRSHADQFTASLVAQINTQAAVDPVLCAQNLSQEQPSAERATINGNQASVLVHQRFGGDQTNVKVDLIKDGQWKLDKITCLE